MAKKAFRTVRFRPESRIKVSQMIDIIEEYQDQGLRMTARQLYYQLVSRDLIPNQPAEYKKVTALLTDARYAGLVDWDAIEDRGREPVSMSEWNGLASLTETALRAYRLPRWEGQDYYVELWVEKQALAGVLQPLASEHHVTLMVNKGYSSASAMKESADRIRRKTIADPKAYERFMHEYAKRIEMYKKGDIGPDDWRKERDRRNNEFKTVHAPRKPVVFYLGDHDPSGEDMVRDIEERLLEFGVPSTLEVKKIGLTIQQVREYDPPPNPAKITDPRAKAYIRKFGDKSWEVDALRPDVLARLIRAAFAGVIDKSKMDEIKRREEEDKKRLRKAVEGLGGPPPEVEEPEEEDEEEDDRRYDDEDEGDE